MKVKTQEGSFVEIDFVFLLSHLLISLDNFVLIINYYLNFVKMFNLWKDVLTNFFGGLYDNDIFKNFKNYYILSVFVKTASQKSKIKKCKLLITLTV